MRICAKIWVLPLMALPGSAAADRTEPASSAPFRRLRETTLEYHGPDQALASLTEYRIGWFGPTNLDDPLTGDLWWAATFAVQELGARRAEVPIRLVPRWAVDPWGTGVSQLTRMVFEEQPLALLGSVDSATTHLAEQVVAKAQLPLVSPVATDGSITLAGVAWMFACAPVDDAIAPALVGDLLGAAPVRWALLAATDHASRMTARAVLKECSRRGRLPDYRFDVPPGTRPVPQQLAALAAASPAAVLILAGPEDAARLVCAARERLTAGCPIFGGPTMGRYRFAELAGSAAEGTRFPLLFTPDRSHPAAERFVEQFRHARGHSPDYAAALTYDATRLVLEAIERAGPDRARIRIALTKLSPWSGVAGPIQFDGTGQNTRRICRMATVRNGTIVPDPI